MDFKEYFSHYNICESLVIKFRFLSETGSVDLQFDNAAASFASSEVRCDKYPKREFHRLVFGDVTHPKFGGRKCCLAEFESLLRKVPSLRAAITLVNPVFAVGEMSITLGFQEYGKFSFAFKVFRQEVIVAVPRRRGNKWLYLDESSGREISIQSPFPNVE